jgi:hypothetical protein
MPTLPWKNGCKVLQIYRTVFSFLLLVIITGCKEEFPTYSTSISTPTHIFPCLRYIGLSKGDNYRVQQAFGLENNDTCTYTVTLTRYTIGRCNNPVVKSVGGDFNGYVRIEVKKGFKCYYKIQSDFKHDATAAFERILNEIKKSIK